MHGRPAPQHSPTETSLSHPQRWRIRAVILLALVVTSIDHSILNVALPSLVAELGAGSSQLQWVVDAYIIVFAGLLLTAGSLGDRFGRRRALVAGIVIFAAGSSAAALATSTTNLIVGRAVMGVGGALIMPTTLSILVNVFGDPRERTRAIGAWAAASGVGIALGPIAGGLLMRQFSWSSVFWINVPLLAVALVGTLHLIPDSRDPKATRLDPVGALLSVAAIASLVYSIIEAPRQGWATATVTSVAVGGATLVLFVLWELRRHDPMLDLRLFRDRAFSGASFALALLFLAMSGAIFLQAQYLQFVLDYTPLVAGLALLPAAVGMLGGTGVSSHLSTRVGARITVAVGILTATVGLALQAALADGGSYLPTGFGLLLFGLGAGMAMPAATDSIMSTLPPSRAGVGSAVNDTVREVGGALGVAIIGSVAAANYSAGIERKLARFGDLSEPVRAVLAENVGAALGMSQELGRNGAEIADLARDAFVTSMSTSLWVAAGVTLSATMATFIYMPRRAQSSPASPDGGEPPGDRGGVPLAPVGTTAPAAH